MPHFVRVPTIEAGDDDDKMILINIDHILWVDEFDGRAVLDFGDGVSRTIDLSLEEFLRLSKQA